MTEPTKGPWQVRETDDWISVGTGRPGDVLLADMMGWRSPEGDGDTPPRSREECRANARLMAAAPELLAACEYAADMLSQRVSDDETMADRLAAVGGARLAKLVREAMAKAKAH